MQVPVELKRNYLNRRIQDIQNLKSSLENNDFTGALKLGHQVKGNALTFDFPQMAQLGWKIENAAKQRDKEELASLLRIMEGLIQSEQETFQ